MMTIWNGTLPNKDLLQHIHTWFKQEENPSYEKLVAHFYKCDEEKLKKYKDKILIHHDYSDGNFFTIHHGYSIIPKILHKYLMNNILAIMK